MMGDTHVYANHVEPLKQQLLNVPRHLPVGGLGGRQKNGGRRGEGRGLGKCAWYLTCVQCGGARRWVQGRGRGVLGQRGPTNVPAPQVGCLPAPPSSLLLCKPHTHTLTHTCPLPPPTTPTHPHPGCPQTLRLNPDKTDIDSFVFDDFTLEGYAPHAKIEMKMAV